MQIIPAIDLKEGQCVRLQQGKFNKTTVYPTSPIALAQDYANRGAKHLHIVDLDGAKLGEIQQLTLIKAMQPEGVTLQVGGGIRTLASAHAAIAAGIEKLVIGSIAINNPTLTKQLIAEIGAKAIVLALDVNIEEGQPKPAICGWQTNTTLCLWDVISAYQEVGITEVLCTDIAKDGMMSGPNFALYEEAIGRFPKVNWQASGGIRNHEDLAILNKLGLRAAILGRALYEGDFFDLSFERANYACEKNHSLS